MFALCVLMMLICNSSATAPIHCWDLTSAGASLSDSCGSSTALSKQVGNDGGPHCDASGCIFDDNGSFQGPFPASLTNTWTIAAWVLMRSTSCVFQISAGSTSLLRMETEPQAFRAHFGAQNDGFYVDSAVSEWYEKSWLFFYISADPSRCLYGMYLGEEGGFQGNFISPHDLSSATTITLGNNFAGNKPVRTLKRVELYDYTINTVTSPINRDTLLENTPCNNFLTPPLCEDTYISLKMILSYVSGQSVVDTSGNGYDGLLGTDLTTTADPTMQESGYFSSYQGAHFSGSQSITVNGFSITSDTFTIYMWLYFTASTSQAVFRDSGSTFTLTVIPMVNVFSLGGGGSFVHLLGFKPTFVWSLYTIGITKDTLSTKLVSATVNGVIQTDSITFATSPISSIVLGQTLQGRMRDFKFFTAFMGIESFHNPPLLYTICPIGQFYDQALRTCSSKIALIQSDCHSLCSNCRDAQNLFCGACNAPAFLTTPGVPDVCNVIIACHDSCITCNGPYESDCQTCEPVYIQNFQDGNQGECIDNCSDKVAQGFPVTGQCSIDTIRLEMRLSFPTEQMSPLLLTFNQPILIISQALFLLSVSTHSYSNIPYSLLTPANFYTSSIQISLSPSASIPPNQNMEITLQSANSVLSTQSSQVQVPPTLSTPSTSSPQYEHVSQQMLNYVDYVTFSAQSLFLGTLIALVALQFLQQVLLLILSQLSSQIFWSIVNLDQLLLMAPMMALNLPRHVFLFFKSLSFAVGDLYVILLFFQTFIAPYLRLSTQAPYNSNFMKMGKSPFSQIGYQSTSVLLESKSFQIITLTSLFVLSMIILLRKCARSTSRCYRNLTSIGRGFICTFYIRMVIEALLQILLFSLLNLKVQIQQNFSNIVTYSDYASALLAQLIFLLLPLFPFAVLRILFKPSSLLKSGTKTFAKYGELYRNFKYEEDLNAKLYPFLFMIRRFFFIFILVFIPNGSLQLFLSITLAFLEIIFLRRIKPYKANCDNSISVMNELFLVAVYICFGLMHRTDINDELIGWVSIGLVGLVNIINIVVFLTIRFKECREKRRRQRKKRAIIPEAQKTGSKSLFAPNESQDFLNQSKDLQLSRFMILTRHNVPNGIFSQNLRKKGYSEKEAISQIKLEDM